MNGYLLTLVTRRAHAPTPRVKIPNPSILVTIITEIQIGFFQPVTGIPCGSRVFWVEEGSKGRWYRDFTAFGNAADTGGVVGRNSLALLRPGLIVLQ